MCRMWSMHRRVPEQGSRVVGRGSQNFSCALGDFLCVSAVKTEPPIAGFVWVRREKNNPLKRKLNGLLEEPQGFCSVNSVAMFLFNAIKSPVLLWLKAGLFGLLFIVSAAMLIVTDNRWYEVVLLAICVWSACRLYYFFFYVLEHYIGGDKNASLFAMVLKCIWKTETSDMDYNQK